MAGVIENTEKLEQSMTVEWRRHICNMTEVDVRVTTMRIIILY